MNEKPVSLWAGVLIVIMFSGCAGSPGAADPMESESLAGLFSALDGAGTPEAGEQVFKSWKEGRNFPLVLGAWPGSASVTFVYWAPNPKQETVLELESHPTPIPMKKWKSTCLRYLTVTLDEPEKEAYSFASLINGIKGVSLTDPLNPFLRYARIGRSLIRREGNPYSAVYWFPKVVSENPFHALPVRPLLVWLPSGYFSTPDRRYPTLYLHDGQQILDSNKAAGGGWKVDSSVETLASRGDAEKVIVVGVFNSSKRDDEMMGWSTYHQSDRTEQNQAPEETLKIAQAYDYYVTTEIKALVDSTFRTSPGRESTAIAGASSGAMVALYEIFTHPEIYSKAAALSGGMPYYSDLLRDFAPKTLDLNIYMDCGDKDLDAELLPASLEMDLGLQALGFVPGKNYFYQTVQGGTHNESNWAKRVPIFLKQFYPSLNPENRGTGADSEVQ